MQVRGLIAALNANHRYNYKSPESTVDHLVIGGGVVGLAIARALSLRYPDKSTYLVERHSRVGEEISSRNSEVIHAGIYYPSNSLKTRLCLRGRHLLYDYCDSAQVPYKKTGKLVLARDGQEEYLQSLHAKAQALTWPLHSSSYPNDARVASTQLLNSHEARDLEPDLSHHITAALLSPETGIIDSHSLMKSFEKDIEESCAGALAYATRVVRVDPYQRSYQAIGSPDVDDVEDGWVVQTVTGNTDNSSVGDALLARTLINASGLSGALVLNALLPPGKRIPMYYARGSYASYRGPGTERVRRLLYPVPDNTGNKGHAFQSLGTHLTLDLHGNIRFGPDLEWVNAPSMQRDEPPDPEFWTNHLVPDDSRIADMHKAVTSYLPGVKLEGLQPDYAGFRPKLVAPPNSGFQDFVIRKDYPASFLGRYEKQDRRCPMISLLGIESPGLTSCLAIAEMVVEDLMKRDGPTA